MRQHLKIEFRKNLYDPEWDMFLSTLTEGDFRQYSAWGRARKKLGEECERILLFDQHQLVGGAQVMILHHHRVGSIGLIYQGPVLVDSSNQLYKLELVKAIRNFTHERQLSYLICKPPYGLKEVKGMFVTDRFYPKYERLPPNLFFDSTLWVDLAGSEEDLYRRLHKNVQRRIKKNHPVVFRDGTRADVATFYNLLKELSQRKHAPMLDPELSFYENVFDEFCATDQFVFRLGTVDNEVTCGSMGFVAGKTCIAWQWGWDGRFGQWGVGDYGIWDTILTAKRLGCEILDFMMIDKISAEALLSGGEIPEQIKNRYFFGPTQFKLGAGGRIVETEGVFCYYPNRMKYLLFHRIFPWAVKQKWLTRVRMSLCI